MTKKNPKKKQAQELTFKSLLKISFLSLAMAFVIAYSFSTDFFPKKSKELIAHKKNYKPIITKRDIALHNAISLKQVKEIIASSNKELQKYTKEKNNIIAKDRVFGYTSLRNFILGTSNPLLSFTISLFFLFIVVKYINDKLMKRYYVITSFVFVVTSGYWLSWSLLSFSLDPKRGFDFPKSWYYVCIYILPTLAFFAAYFWFKYNKSAVTKLKEALQIAIKFMVQDVKNEYVDEPKKKKYTKSYFNILKKINEKV